MFGKEKLIVVKSAEFRGLKVPYGQTVIQRRYDRPQEKDHENDQGRKDKPDGVHAPFFFCLHSKPPYMNGRPAHPGGHTFFSQTIRFYSQS